MHLGQRAGCVCVERRRRVECDTDVSGMCYYVCVALNKSRRQESLTATPGFLLLCLLGTVLL